MRTVLIHTSIAPVTACAGSPGSLEAYCQQTEADL